MSSLDNIKIGQVLKRKADGVKFVCLEKEICNDDDYYSSIRLVSESIYNYYSGKRVPLQKIKSFYVENGCDGIEVDFEILEDIKDVTIEKLAYFRNNSRNIITLCGSTRFKNEFLKLAKELTLRGNIVFYPILFSHSENKRYDEETLKMLSEIHKCKIEMSDEIFVINKDGYIGESTKEEIKYAKDLGKRISYLEVKI